MADWNAHAFVEALREHQSTPILDDLVENVAAAVIAARLHWNDVPVPLGLSRFLAERIFDTANQAQPKLSTTVRDLYLACACLSGDAKAIGHIRALFLAAARPVWAKLQLETATSDDLEQHILERLLVPASGGKLSGFSGRGSLRSWLRSFALRTALKRNARRHRPQGGDTELEVLATPDRLEADYLREHFGAQFREAFALAFQALTPRQRNLLRQHYLDGLTLVQLAQLYRVNRSTVVRWLGGARAALMRGTRTLAARKLGVPGSDFDSVLRVLWSDVRTGLRELVRSNRSESVAVREPGE